MSLSASASTSNMDIDPGELPQPAFDLSRIDDDVTLIQRVLASEEKGENQKASSLDGYNQELSYTLEQLGGKERAYHLFLGSPFAQQGLPSRRHLLNSHALFTILDLPVLRQLRAAHTAHRPFDQAVHIATESVRLFQKGAVMTARAAADTMLSREVREPLDFARILVASVIEGVVSR